MIDNRPEIIKQLSIAREIFDSANGKNENESMHVQNLLGFFYKKKFLTSEQVAFGQKLIKLSQQMRKP